jgi:hypothetical protein
MEPPSPQASGRSGLLFETASDDEGRSAPEKNPRYAAAEDVFPVNNPPKRRKDTVNAVTRANSENSKRRVQGKKPSSAANAAPPVSSTAAGPSSVSGMAVNPCQIESPHTQVGNDDFLDDRNVTDPDELYGENERALSNFIRLHPMLS